MSDYVTARAIRDASREIMLALAMCSMFIVVALPISSVVIVHTAAKWRINAWMNQMEKVTEKAATETPSR